MCIEPFQQGTDLVVSDITTTTAVISWSPVECRTTNYTVSYTWVNIEKCQLNNTEKIVGTTTNSSVTLTGLEPVSFYEVTVRASTAEGVLRTLTAGFITHATSSKL